MATPIWTASCFGGGIGEYWQVRGLNPQSLVEAEEIVATYAPSITASVSQIDLVDNYYDPPFIGGGYFPQGVLFPGVAPIQGDPSGDWFVFRVTGAIEIPVSGVYSFGSLSDDGCRLRIGDQVVLEHEVPVFEAYATHTLSAGVHAFELLYLARYWSDQLEVFAQPGAYSEFNAGFKVIGDELGGGLRILGTTTGDLDHDGTVGGSDLGILLEGWGACAACPADLNGDGVVDGADVGLLLGNWS